MFKRDKKKKKKTLELSDEDHALTDVWMTAAAAASATYIRVYRMNE